jgi:predicted DNA-binding transcriptional regulator AlpA
MNTDFQPAGLRERPARQYLGNLPRSTFLARVRDGRIPRPVKLGRVSIWLKSELDAFLAARAAERDAARRV